jgi:putative restriction endonuclease
MNLWIGITDGDWYRHLRAQPDLDEVNFWQPSGRRQFRKRKFRALAPGGPVECSSSSAASPRVLF